jgi:hypothetical protein
MSNEFIVKNGLIVGGNVVTSGTITINGALAATQSWVTSQGYLTSASLSGYATQSYVTSAIAALVDSAPAALDTLNELAAALGDDANFATTITTSIGNKVSKSGDTMTGSLLFSAVANNVRLEKSGSFLNLLDTYSNIHLYNGGNGVYVDSTIHYWRSTGAVYWMTLGSSGLNVAQNITLGTNGGSAGDTNNIVFPTVNGTYTGVPNGIYYTKKGNWGGQIDIRTSYDWGYSTDNAKISLNGAAANGITFSTGASVSGSTERMRITETGNVGIANSSPSYRLDIATSSLGGNNVAVRLTDAYQRVRFNEFDILGYSSQLWMIGQPGSSSLVIGDSWDWDRQVEFQYIPNTVGAANGVVTIGQLQKNSSTYTHGITRFFTNGSERLRIDSSGNVGIGTSSPVSKLHVVGPINIERTGVANVYSTVDMEGNFRFNASGGYAHTFLNNGSELVRIMPSGNVGIGTTAPDARLHVYSAGSGTTLAVGRASGNSSIKASSDAAGGYLSLDSTGGATIINHYVSDNVWLASGGGNVGVNNSSPSYKLDVTGDINFTSTLKFGGVTVLSNAADDVYGNIRVIRNRSTSLNDGMYLNYDSTGGSSAHLRFFANGQTERMRIDASNGNVGIGTTSPTQKLEVGSFLDAVTNRITVAARYEYEPEFNFRLGQSGTNLDWVGAVISSGDDGNYNGKILFKTANAGRDTPTTKMAIKANGNVGIGTVSPSEKLHVVGNQYITGNITVGASGNYSNVNFVRADGAGVGGIGWRSDGIFYVGGHLDYGPNAGNAVRVYGFGANLSLGNNTAGDVLTVTNGGNVGIGTTAPAIPRGSGFRPMLHVYNNSAGTNPAIVVSAEDSQMAGYIAGDNAGGSDIGWGWNAYYQGNGNNFYNIRIGDNGTWTDRFTIDRYGKVGIGTTSPSEEFHVLGRGIFDGGSGNSSTDAVVYITKSNNNDWGLYVNASGLDYGMYTRVSPSAGYAIGVNNGTNWTTRITGDGRIYLNEKDTIASYDTWLRLNDSSHYGSGVYTPGILRSDGLLINYGGGRLYAGLIVEAGATISGTGGDGSEVLRLTGSASDAFNYSTASVWGNLTAGETVAHVIGKAESQYNTANFGYRHVADGSPSNHITIGMFQADNLLNILGNGNVGIGTTTPGYKLDINGNSRTTGIHYVDTYLVTPYIYGGGPITMGNNVFINSTEDGKLTLRVPSGDSSEWNYINFTGSNGVRDAYLGTDGGGTPTWYRDDNGVNISLGSSVLINGNTAWHAGNDGTGSGLDADTVDGVQADSIVYGNARGTNQSITNNNNDLDKTGYYTADAFTTRPSGVANWMYIEHIKLYNDNTAYQKQLGYDTYDDRMWVRTKNAGTWSSWKQIWTSDSLTNLNQLTNGPGYITGYTETDTLQSVTSRGASTNTGLYINNNNPTLYLQDTDHRSAMIHVNSDYFYILNGAGTNSTGWAQQANSRWLFMGNLNNNDITFGGSGDFAGTVTASGGNSSNWNTAYGWGNHASAGYATTSYVTTQINNLIAGAPGALDTLDELAAALGDDSNFATTVTNSIAGKVSKSGDTMTGALTLNAGLNAYASPIYVNEIRFRDTAGSPQSDPYSMRWISEASARGAGNSWLEFQLNDDNNEEIRIYGNSCVGYGCGSVSENLYHVFRADGYAWHAGNLVVVGTISASGYNSGNWDTAYGWGNHASAGYALNSALANYLPLSGGSIGGALTVNGNLTVNGTITENSSIKLKENVETSEGNLEKVVNLRPVTYNKIGSQTTELGLIAEEVAEVYPEFVQYDENGEPIGVHYSRLTAALIGAVKELTNQVQELNKKING